MNSQLHQGSYTERNSKRMEQFSMCDDKLNQKKES